MTTAGLASVFAPDLRTLATFARAAAFLFAAPLTGEPSVAPRVRVGVAAALAFVLAPARPALAEDDLATILVAELLLGLLAGFSARLVLAGVEAGGELVGLSLGLGFAESYDPRLGEAAQPTRRLAATLGAFAFLGAGGLEAGVRVIAGPWIGPAELALGLGPLLARGGDVFVAALRLAAPALLAATIANVALALASRAAPALNAFSVLLAAVLLFVGGVVLATLPATARELAAGGNRAVDMVLDLGGAR